MTETSSSGPEHPYPIRPIGPDEFDRFELVDQHGFHGGPMPDSDRQRVLAGFEYDRSLAAFDGGTPVGVAIAYSFRLSVPGSELLRAAGVSWVSVLPTYRRRGVLSSLMRRQLDDVRQRGEPLAVLWASEATIYSRFGYGRASWHLGFTFGRGEGTLAATGQGADRGLGLRLADPSAALPELAKVYDTVLSARPGFFARNDWWWQRMIRDPADERQGASPLRCLLAEDDSGPRGYALYSATGHPDTGEFLPAATLTVRELMSADPAASAALWTDLLSRDLTNQFRARLRPVDDPLLYQLADPRRARPQLADGLWVRIIDLPGALTGRRYASPVDVVIDVRDDILPANAGRWRLTTATSGAIGASGSSGDGGASGAGAGAGDGGGGLAASCVRVTSAADLVLDVTQLGAAYLGGTRLGALAAAGLVAELRPGAVRQLSAAMSWDPAPWCPAIF